MHSGNIRGRIIEGVIAMLIGSHLLLPIERGFPRIYIFSIPITFTTIILLAIFLCLIVVNHQLHINAYVVAQSLLCLTLLASISMNPVADLKTQLVGCFAIFQQFVTFVIGYWVIRYFVQAGFKEILIRWIRVFGGAAAFIGVLEGYFHIMLPFYKQYYNGLMAYPIDLFIFHPSYRVYGTLGNPILFSVAMILLIPFVSGIKWSIVRAILLFLLILAGFATRSRTLMIGIVIIGIGILSICFRRRKIATMLVLLLAAVLGIGLLLDANISLDTFVERTMDEVGSRDNFSNVNIRLAAWNSAINTVLEETDLVRVLFGYGVYSANTIPTELGYATLSTIDNNQITILYEGGILSFGVYLIGFAFVLLPKFRGATRQLHWWNILALFFIGFSFVTLRYQSFNILWVTSVVIVQNLDESNGQYNHNWRKTG